LCFIARISRPPTCTLSPYTTLFRSRRERPLRVPVQRLAQAQGLLPLGLRQGVHQQGEAGLLIVLPQLFTVFHASPPPFPSAGAPDRKSTRLNSSHVSISYAVFCLNK